MESVYMSEKHEALTNEPFGRAVVIRDTASGITLARINTPDSFPVIDALRAFRSLPFILRTDLLEPMDLYLANLVQTHADPAVREALNA